MNLNDIKEFHRELEHFVSTLYAQLKATNLHVTDLKQQVDAMQPAEPEVPEMPEAPVEVTYELVDPNSKYSIEQYEASKWTKEAMLAKGIIKAVEAVPEIPEAPVEEEVPDEVPPPPTLIKEEPIPEPKKETIEIDGTYYKMAPKASGATATQFYIKGWDKAALLKGGFLEALPDVPEMPKLDSDEAPDVPEMPTADVITDKGGVIYDPVKHGTSKDGSPALTKAGMFKKKKGYVEPDSHTTVPKTDVPKQIELPDVPEAPEPNLDIVPDEPLGGELEDLIKDWKD